MASRPLPLMSITLSLLTHASVCTYVPSMSVILSRVLPKFKGNLSIYVHTYVVAFPPFSCRLPPHWAAQLLLRVLTAHTAQEEGERRHRYSEHTGFGQPSQEVWLSCHGKAPTPTQEGAAR